MVSLEDANSYSRSHTMSNISNSTTSSRFQHTRPYYYSPSPSYSSSRMGRAMGRSMRTVRSNFSQTGDGESRRTSPHDSGNLTDSVIDLRLGELATKPEQKPKNSISNEEFLEMSRAFSDFSACSSDISGELERLANIPSPNESPIKDSRPEIEPEPCYGFLQRESFSTEIIESISPEDLQPTVKLCIDGLNSSSINVKRSAAAKLRMLAKNRADNRALIGESGAIDSLIPLLKCSDSWTQEHAVTALLNLSLHDSNKGLLSSAGAMKALIYVLKTGTDVSKQNAACALLSLALVDDGNKVSIGACGAIPPLVGLLMSGTSRGKKDAMTTLYKLCSVEVNKVRTVSAGAVKPLVAMVMEDRKSVV